MCETHAECASGKCYQLALFGGFCGECLSDDDCMWGCGLPAPLTDPPRGSTCDDGSMGAGCESDRACQDPPVCAEVLALPGIFVINGCSACASDDECADGQLCSPNYDGLSELERHWQCVEPGSQPLGAGCDLMGTGTQACASGSCVAADFSGLIELGICSSCAADDDCGMGTCAAPTVDTDGTITPGSCV
jgi:hypothetical protein